MSSLWSLRLRWADSKMFSVNTAKARVKNKNATLCKLRLLLSNAGYTLPCPFMLGWPTTNIWTKRNNPWRGMVFANIRGTHHCLHPANVQEKPFLKDLLILAYSTQYLPCPLFICAYLLTFPPWLLFYSVGNFWLNLLLCHQIHELLLWLLSLGKFHCVVIWIFSFSLVNWTNILPHKSEAQSCIPRPHSPGSCGMEYQWN